MKITDPFGNELKEGVPIAFPLAFGQGVAGNIVKVTTGLGVGPDAIPQVLAGFVLPLQVAPNGTVGGIFVVAEQTLAAVA
jgi:hypothetical protein